MAVAGRCGRTLLELSPMEKGDLSDLRGREGKKPPEDILISEIQPPVGGGREISLWKRAYAIPNSQGDPDKTDIMPGTTRPPKPQENTQGKEEAHQA